MAAKYLRVVSVMEADFVTGPAKNLLEFAQRSRLADEDLPAVDLSIVAYLRGDQPETAFIRTAREAGVAIDIIRERGRFDLKVLPKLRQIAQTRDPHIFQTHNVKSHCMFRMSGIWRERAWLAFHHGYTTTDLKMRGYNLVDRWSLPAARHVVTVCGPFVDLLEKRGIARANITVLHNSVKYQAASPEAVRSAREEIPAAAGVPILLSVGRLSREKGHVDLLRALAKLREANQPFHLVIVGEGADRKLIETERQRLGLDAHVTLLGLRHQVQPYYALADIAVIPSRSEGSPNVLLEAMIAARPIVATRVGGIPEIVTHEDAALLVPSRDPEAMARALARMLGDLSLRERLARRAFEVACTSYSPEAYRRSLVQLYQRVLSAGAAL